MSNLYGEAEFRERRAYNPQSVISRHSDEYSRNDRTWQYTLAGESGEVGKRLDTRKEEVCAAFNRVKASKHFIILRIGRFGRVKSNVPSCAPIIGSCSLPNS